MTDDAIEEALGPPAHSDGGECAAARCGCQCATPAERVVLLRLQRDWLLADAAALSAEVASLKRLALALAERVLAQSEILSRRAEKIT